MCSSGTLCFRPQEWPDGPVGGQSSIKERAEELTSANNVWELLGCSHLWRRYSYGNLGEKSLKGRRPLSSVELKPRLTPWFLQMVILR